MGVVNTRKKGESSGNTVSEFLALFPIPLDSRFSMDRLEHLFPLKSPEGYLGQYIHVKQSPTRSHLFL